MRGQGQIPAPRIRRMAGQLGRLDHAVRREVGDKGSRAEVFCPFCGVRQSKADNLWRHVRDRCTMLATDRLECPICPHWCYKSRKTLASHVRCFHGH